MAELHTDGPEQEDAYARHFALVLRALLETRPDLRRLLSARECALAAAFLTSLAPPERRLFARMFQRKGPWFRSSSLVRYFLWRPYVPVAPESDTNDTAGMEHTENDGSRAAAVTTSDTRADALTEEEPEQPDNALVQTALRSLVAHGFLETLSVRHTDATVPSAFIATHKSASGQQEEDADLALALDALHQCATAPELATLQKRLTGSKTKPKPKPKTSTGRSTSAPTLLSSSKADAFEAIRKVVMTQRRIDGSRIPLASLLHELLLESYPLAGKSRADVLVVHVPAAVRDLFARLHRLYYFQASLPFSQPSTDGRTTDCSEREALERAVARLTQDAVQWPGLMVLFRKVTYPTYAITIRQPVFPSSEAYVCFEAASRLHRVIVAFEMFVELPTPTGASEAEPDLDVKWVAFDSAPQLLAFQRLGATDDDGFEILGPEPDDTASDWQMESWRQFDTQLRSMTTLDDLVLETRRCFYAFVRYTKTPTRLVVVVEPPRPAFFAKCNAGYHLARVLHHAAALYEKRRQYQVAILLLNDLLDAPFLSRKRGHWWERLAVNLEHLKCTDQATSACRNALRDTAVVGADRIALSRRWRRLEKRFSGTEAALSTSRRSADERDDDDFVGSDDNGGDTVVVSSTDPSVLVDEYDYRKEHIVGRPLNRQTAEKSRFIGYDDEPCTVEQLVLQYYRSERKMDTPPPTASESSKDSGITTRGGWYGVHCEGRVLGNVFGLCMWDVLYASVPDVFQTPFQSAPLDFGDADAFYTSRRALIDARLAQLEYASSLEEIVAAMGETWEREYGKVSRFVSWPERETSDLPLSFHQLVVLAMGRASLAKLMRYMLTSPEYHRAQNGLPDLLLVRGERTSGSLVKDLLPVDASGCLDIYTLCNMACELNLNGTLQDRTSTVPSSGDRDVALLDRLCLDEWTLKLKLVEVKGPRDRLSDKQQLWLQVLNEDVGVDAAVTHVVEDAQTLEKLRNLPQMKAKRAPKAATGPTGAGSKTKSVAKRQKR